MQVHFWGRDARRGKEWYEPEPGRAIFLAAFLIKLGEIRFGPNWSGAIDKPSETQAEALIIEIAQVAASGIIPTHVINPRTFEFQPIACAGWRNPQALAARFSRCRIDASDPVNNEAEGRHHGRIFVQRPEAISYLEQVRTAVVADGSTLTLDHLSGYVRFMIFVSQSEQLDENAPMLKKKLESKIAKLWPQWRATHGAGGDLPPQAILASTKVAQMATLLRGEKANSIKLGAERKK